MKKLLILFGLFIVIWLPTAVQAKILVVAPHPDDDVACYAGITFRAIARGEPVEIVYMTNGDEQGTDIGLQRQYEAVTAQVNYLGLTEDDLIFLGYPDGGLSDLYNLYPNQTDTFTAPNGQSTTYGNRGLGRIDYHTYRFGSPAAYNGYNVIMDLKDIITNFQPDYILTLSPYDVHPDHSATYDFVVATLKSLNIPNYNPTVCQSIVHDSEGNVIWPSPIDPTSYFTEIPNLADMSQNQLNWSQRQSIDVPLAMQSTNYLTNPKYLAANSHVTQGGVSGLLGQFIHKDEFFWAQNILGTNQPPIVNAGVDQTVVDGALVTLNGSGSSDPDGDTLSYQWRQVSGPSVQLTNADSANPTFTAPADLADQAILSFELVVSDGQFNSLPDAVSVVVNPFSGYGNIAPLATVTASSQSTQTQQAAAKAVDGVIDGYPGDYTKEWATTGEGAGAWLKLTWNSPYVVDKVVLYDRPNLSDQILLATLTFNDGSSVQVGPLDNGGAATTFTFPAKTITQMTMTVNKVSNTTGNIGLAEIMVYGYNAQSGGDNPPVANAGADQTVNGGTQVTLDGSGSTDPDGNTLSYQWQQLSGPSVQLTNANSVTATFTAPTGLTVDTVLTFQLTVSDGQLSNSATINITVKGSQKNYGNIASAATATASSETPQYGQTAAKAIDGVVDGYPGDYTKEWATLGEGPGAWLKLTWSSVYLVDKVVLYDRPNLNDQILGATLSFSDGSTVQVGALDNAGAGVEIDFPTKAINQLTLTVNSVSGTTYNIGLAEIMVYGTPSSGNNPPVANAGADQTVLEGQQVTLDGTGSSDSDGGDTLSYQWQQVSGPAVQLTNASSATASFTAPTGLSQDTEFTFQLTVSDGQMSSSDSVNITVATQAYTNIAPLATATASSQNTQTGQTAAKAIDGVVNGYPGDYTKEWATLGEGAGAWLKLTWSNTYVVDKIVIFDRPNLNDQILGATLTFSDGSTIQVGALDNDGSGVEIDFPPKSINQLTLTVNLVSGTTANIGLAEIQVFGAAQ